MERCASSSTSRQPSKVGAVCGNAARTVLCGGRSAMIVPTATTEPVTLRKPRHRLLGTWRGSSVSNLLMKLIRRSLLFGLVTATLAGCVFGLYSYRLKRSADALCDVAYELSGKEQTRTLQNIRQRLGAELKQPDPCTSYGCGYEVLLYNRVLAAIHFPYAVFRSYFWVRNGDIDSNRLEFWTVSGRAIVALSYVDIKYCDRCDSVVIVPRQASSPLGGTGSVEVGSASSENMKRIALALDTGCITRLGGCTNIAELSPKVWRQTSPRIISCRITTHEGVIDNASE
jgi:hypothetical protein